MNKQEASELIDTLISEMHSHMEQIEELAAEFDIMVDHPFREYGEQGSATYLTKNNIKEYLRDKSYDESDFDYLIDQVDYRLPDWVSSYAFE